MPKIKHGHSFAGHVTSEYQCWRGIKYRCLNPRCKAYPYYGGRGIAICDRWINSFENFLQDMGPRPAGMTIDRIDCNGHYEPGNCRWATRAEQVANRRTTRTAFINGEELPLKEACDRLNLNFKTVAERLRRGWSADRALTSPLWHHPNHPNAKKVA